VVVDHDLLATHRTYHDLIGCRHVDVHGDPLHRDNLDAHHRPLGVQHHDQALLGAECVVMGLVIGVGRGDSDRLKDELFATHLHGAVCSSVTMRLRTRIPPTGTDCVVNRSCSSERVTSTVPLAASVTGASGVVLGVVSGVGGRVVKPPAAWIGADPGGGAPVRAVMGVHRGTRESGAVCWIDHDQLQGSGR